eukprot:4354789-Prorocentrum_lima.AAC.1
MEIKTLCTESSMDQRHNGLSAHTGQVHTWKEHHCIWPHKGSSEREVEGHTREVTAAICDQVVHTE